MVNSSIKGKINTDKVSSAVAVTLDADSSITLTGNSYISSLSNSDSTGSNINKGSYTFADYNGNSYTATGTDTTTDKATDSVTETAKETAIETASETVIETTTETITDTVTDTLTDSITDSVTDTVTDKLTDVGIDSTPKTSFETNSDTLIVPNSNFPQENATVTDNFSLRTFVRNNISILIPIFSIIMLLIIIFKFA